MNNIITFTLENFTGPLDLLYHLVEKNELDIYDIPISEITAQYIHFISQWKEPDMDSLSEFVLMAAALLEIKSKMLLPKISSGAPEADPRAELVQRLIEYKRYRSVLDYFKQREEDINYVFRKPDFLGLDEIIPKTSVEELLDGVSIGMIFDAFNEVLKRQETKFDDIRASFGKLNRDIFTIEDRIEFIRSFLLERKRIKFGDFFQSSSPKIEKVVVFLALLELMKQNEIAVEQNEILGQIYITGARQAVNKQEDLRL